MTFQKVHRRQNAVRATLLCTLAALPLPTGLVSLTPSAAEAQAYQVSTIDVRGNRRVDVSTVSAFLALPRGAVTAGQLNEAYQRLVASGLFEEVEIEPRGSTLVVTVKEWPIVRRISIEGNTRVDDEDLTPLLGSVPNRVFNPDQVEEDAAALAGAYEQRGNLAAAVTPRLIRRGNDQVDVVFEVAEGRVVEIERLSFVGNRSYSDRRLRRALATKQAGLLRQFIGSDTFVAEREQFDRRLLTDFYQSRGFIDFRIRSVSNQFSRERNAFFVQYNIQEGNRWSFGRITASSDIPGLNAEDYLAVSRIEPGRYYSPAAIDNAIDRMERLATQNGLSFVRATPQVTRDPRNLQLNVNFRLERGPRIFVERIDIEGNTNTLDRVIRREFTTVEGDPFNPREIRSAAERIRALGYFAEANVDSREGSTPDQVIIDVDVEEQPTGSLSLGAAYATDNGLGLNIGLSERNFLGRGQFLSFNVATGTSTDSASFTFGEPALFGRDLTGQVELYYRKTDFDNAAYNTKEVGFSPSVSFPISRNGRLALRYRIERNELEDVPDDSSPIIQREEGDQIVSSVGYTYSFDNRRSGLDPTSGIVFRFSQDFAGLGGDISFIETNALAAYQRQVWDEEVTLTATIEAGAIHTLSGDTSKVTDRFFLNSRQIRGFEPLGLGPRDLNAPQEDALGGNYYAVARLEAQFPIFIPEEYGITGGVFLDAGSVWDLDDTDGWNGMEVDDDFNLRASAGVALFWDSPFGPLRFNWTTDLKSEDYDKTRNFDVTVSTQF
ncbi:outer membrane protein assembly factor BamA [Palleronia caenipelagi]|uniref:Outer membrane protein assembly factor BamA n=1 Tax=Palleronia caenipelagi TaxID=2489174 RepID=A0A547Q639_9RHOB|nr:outer membrane protein assembly factor BamA [Palleronia caenipelagi]TRD21846.1 outer membrane protein assembly factor BamA [Palleronia caenipelagi]